MPAASGAAVMVLTERRGNMRAFQDAIGNSSKGTSGATALALAVLLAVPAAAESSKFTSTYTDIAQCPVVEAGDDQFTLQCSGPGGATAVLQYVEGRVGLFFKPELAREVGADDLFEIKPGASKVFPGKLEWRTATGGERPCVAIVRVPVAEGNPLLVFDLSSGTVIGQTADNETARSVADRVCNTQLSLPSATAEKEGSQNADDIQQGVIDGQQAYGTTFTESGIAGVQELVEHCYAAARKPSEVARCAQIDALGNINDRIFADRYGMPRYAYFRGHNPQYRLSEAARRLKLPANVVAELSKIFESN